LNVRHLNKRNAMEPELRSLFETLIEGQIRTDKSLNELAVIVTRSVDAAVARMKRIDDEHSNGRQH
jgi:hypothetical protein